MVNSSFIAAFFCCIHLNCHIFYVLIINEFHFLIDISFLLNLLWVGSFQLKETQRESEFFSHEIKGSVNEAIQKGEGIEGMDCEVRLLRPLNGCFVSCPVHTRFIQPFKHYELDLIIGVNKIDLKERIEKWNNKWKQTPNSTVAGRFVM